ncbi:MAG: GGDEF domain-containing protein [Lachnospiraceae bacterium]|nr:GGDEF domain-containing protein [Lachnospiraceae bacterium]
MDMPHDDDIRIQSKKKVGYRKRIYLILVIAIIMQSLLFGCILSLTVIRELWNYPKRARSVAAEEEAEGLSEGMSHMAGVCDDICAMLEREERPQKVHMSMIEALNHMDSATTLFYVNPENGEGICLRDTQPDSVDFSYRDIKCDSGVNMSSVLIEKMPNWSEQMEKSLVSVAAAALEDLQIKENKTDWYAVQNALYRIERVDTKSGTLLFGARISDTLISDLKFQEKQAEYQFFLLIDGKIAYSTECEQLIQQDETISCSIQGRKYVGNLRKVVFEENAGQKTDISIAVLEPKEDNDIWVQRVIFIMMAAYLISVGFAAWIAHLVIPYLFRPFRELKRNMERIDTDNPVLEEGDVEELKEVYQSFNAAVDHIQRQYRYDALTGLYVRDYFKKVSNSRLQKKKDAYGAVIMCDLDNLKRINDTYGHHAGDIYISTFGEFLHQAITGRPAVAGHLSGDEFAVTLYGYADEKAVREAVAQMFSKQPVAMLEEDVSCQIGFSAGVLLIPEWGTADEGIDALLTKADKAMYYVKKNCKGEVSYYEGLQHKEDK